MPTIDKPDALADYSVITSVSVQWGDQDAFGHVNNVVYFRWFESNRMEYATRCGLAAAPQEPELAPILARISCNYRWQVRHPDFLYIGGRMTRIGTSSMTVQHAIYSQQQQKLVADGESVMVLFDYQAQQSHPVPADLRRAVEDLEGCSFDVP